MFQAKKNPANTSQVSLIGVMDETVNLGRLLTGLSGEAHLSCREISRINSLGIKEWRKFFDGVRKSGVKLHFSELSPVIVEQINFISDFISQSEVVSVCLPFLCAKCEQVQLIVRAVEELRSSDLQNPSADCPKCGTAMEFDELPGQYFAFLRAD